MSYYPTLEEDLARAKAILERGKALEEPPESRFALIPADQLMGGTIYGADTYAAYKLLESFIEVIETELGVRPKPEPPIAEQFAQLIEQMRSPTEPIAPDQAWSWGKHLEEVVAQQEEGINALLAEILETRQSEDRAGEGWRESIAINTKAMQELERLARQVEELHVEVEENDAIRAKLSDILSRTANALHGGPMKQGLWGWDNLPDLASELHKTVEELRGKS